MPVQLAVILAVILIALPFGFWMAFGRRRVGVEPSIALRPEDADFYERGASGRCRGHAAGARNCLFVAVGQGELWIKPIFPLKLLAPPGDLGLDVHLPKSAVTSARKEPGLPFGTKVVLQLSAADGAANTVDLFLKSPDALLAALRR
jgi:hypothetical protein